MTKKVLITGSNGLLGFAFANFNFNAEKILCSSEVLDITNFEAVKYFIDKTKPDIIIHCAAYTDVEKCELDIDNAYKINTIGTLNLVNAAICLTKEPIFCFISSTGIYGNYKQEPYNEFDDVTPLSVHHKTKFEAEKIVSSHFKKYIIARTGWLFGGAKTQNKNFVYKRYVEAKNSSILYANSEQIGNPTYIKDVVMQIAYLLEKECFGVYNCVNSGVASRYEYVKKIVELFGLNCDVKPVTADAFKRVAPVSFNESAVNYKLELMGLNKMQNWENSLTDYINELKL